MFFGGTNFGFTAGANSDGPGKYKVNSTKTQKITNLNLFVRTFTTE